MFDFFDFSGKFTFYLCFEMAVNSNKVRTTLFFNISFVNTDTPALTGFRWPNAVAFEMDL